MASISQFNVLLNNLSNELSSENLQSLIYVCGELISERESEKISSGWDAFKILIRRNAIGEKPMKMAFLLGIIKELRPQRKDLVNMVKRYIEDHYREPQKIMDGYENSSDHYILVSPPSAMPLPGESDEEDCQCSTRSRCCSCNFRYKQGSCFCLAMFSILLIAAAGLTISIELLKLKGPHSPPPTPSTPKPSQPPSTTSLHTGACKGSNGNKQGCERKNGNNAKTEKHENGSASEAPTVAGPGRFWPVTIVVLLFLAACFGLLSLYVKGRERKLPCTHPQSNIGNYGSINTDLTGSSSQYTKNTERKCGHKCSCSFGHVAITILSAPLCLASAREDTHYAPLASTNWTVPEAVVFTDDRRRQNEPVQDE